MLGFLRPTLLRWCKITLMKDLHRVQLCSSPGKRVVLQSDSFQMKNHGNFKANLPIAMSVTPPDPFTIKSADSSNCHIELSSTVELDNAVKKTLPENINYSVNTSENLDEISIHGECIDNANETLQKTLTCMAVVPHKYDIDVTAKGNLKVSNTEGGSVKCVSYGSISLHNVKSGTIEVNALDNIKTTKILQGNARLQAQRRGSITSEKLQGQTFMITTEDGDISIDSLYCDETEIYSKKGNVTIKNCHGHCDVYLKCGDLKIDSLDGNLTADIVKGDVDILVTRHTNIDIQIIERGNVTIKIPENLSSSIGLKGNNVKVDQSIVLHQSNVENKSSLAEEIGIIGDLKDAAEKFITVSTKSGTIHVEKKDWFSSLNLKKQ